MPKDKESIRKLVAYAIAGAGFQNMDKYVKEFTVDDLDRLNRLFRKWLDGRKVVAFFRLLFERLNYSCNEVIYFAFSRSCHHRSSFRISDRSL